MASLPSFSGGKVSTLSRTAPSPTTTSTGSKELGSIKVTSEQAAQIPAGTKSPAPVVSVGSASSTPTQVVQTGQKFGTPSNVQTYNKGTTFTYTGGGGGGSPMANSQPYSSGQVLTTPSTNQQISPIVASTGTGYNPATGVNDKNMLPSNQTAAQNALNYNPNVVRTDRGSYYTGSDVFKTSTQAAFVPYSPVLSQPVRFGFGGAISNFFTPKSETFNLGGYQGTAGGEWTFQRDTGLNALKYQFAINPTSFYSPQAQASTIEQEISKELMPKYQNLVDTGKLSVEEAQAGYMKEAGAKWNERINSPEFQNKINTYQGIQNTYSKYTTPDYGAVKTIGEGALIAGSIVPVTSPIVTPVASLYFIGQGAYNIEKSSKNIVYSEPTGMGVFKYAPQEYYAGATQVGLVGIGTGLNLASTQLKEWTFLEKQRILETQPQFNFGLKGGNKYIVKSIQTPYTDVNKGGIKSIMTFETKPIEIGGETKGLTIDFGKSAGMSELKYWDASKFKYVTETKKFEFAGDVFSTGGRTATGNIPESFTPSFGKTTIVPEFGKGTTKPFIGVSTQQGEFIKSISTTNVKPTITGITKTTDVYDITTGTRTINYGFNYKGYLDLKNPSQISVIKDIGAVTESSVGNIGFQGGGTKSSPEFINSLYAPKQISANEKALLSPFVSTTAKESAVVNFPETKFEQSNLVGVLSLTSTKTKTSTTQVLSSQFSAEGLKSSSYTGTLLTPRFNIGFKQRQPQAQIPSLLQGQNQQQQQIQQPQFIQPTPTISTTSITPEIIPPTFGGFPLIPFLKPSFDFNQGTTRNYKGKRKLGYSPDFLSIITGRRGKAPKRSGLFGFGEQARPILKGKSAIASFTTNLGRSMDNRIKSNLKSRGKSFIKNFKRRYKR